MFLKGILQLATQKHDFTLGNYYIRELAQGCFPTSYTRTSDKWQAGLPTGEIFTIT